jgi:phosphatidylethanolamine-binding protein (PEBP) family uncharacterized protein
MHPKKVLAVLTLAGMAALAPIANANEPTKPTTGTSTTPTDTTMPQTGFKIDKGAFLNGKVPESLTCDGAGIAPTLAWSAGPTGTQSYAVIVTDSTGKMAEPGSKPTTAPGSKVPDPGRSPDPGTKVPEVGTMMDEKVHYVVYNIPANTRQITPQNTATFARGTNSAGSTGWDALCPPQGEPAHNYSFHVYALDTMLDLPAGSDKTALKSAMTGHVLAHDTMVATYQRARKMGS